MPVFDLEAWRKKPSLVANLAQASLQDVLAQAGYHAQRPRVLVPVAHGRRVRASRAASEIAAFVWQHAEIAFEHGRHRSTANKQRNKRPYRK